MLCTISTLSTDTLEWCFKTKQGGAGLNLQTKPKSKQEIIGIRPGEKLHEEMISRIDSLNTYELGKIFAIIDPLNAKLIKNYKKFKKMKPYYSYNSFDNKEYLSKEELKRIISKYI